MALWMASSPAPMAASAAPPMMSDSQSTSHSNSSAAMSALKAAEECWVIFQLAKNISWLFIERYDMMCIYTL